jgi:hypothetical protein
MQWVEIRNHYPRQWPLVEAIEARSESGKRIPDQLAAMQAFPDSVEAMRTYAQFHREAPERELYVFHTDCESLDLPERRWLGVRPGSIRSTP